MRTLVTQFDLQCGQDVWAIEGYEAAEILVKNHGVPIGLLRLPLKPGGVLTRAELADFADQACFAASEEAVSPAFPHPRITVVVCTRDRPFALQRCMESLRALQYDNFEVLIVDNGSRSSDTRELAAKTPFRYVREDRPGLPWARNCGLYASNSEIVAYTDDDVTVDPGWLRGIAHGFRDPSVACVTGLVCPFELETSAQTLFEQYGGMGKGFTPRLLDPAKMGPGDLIAAHAAGVGANVAFRREVLLKLGGFDVHLGVGTPSHGGEDLDIFHRTLWAGHIIRYEPLALVRHQHRRSMAALHRQISDNGRAFGCYLLKIASNRTVPRREVAKFARKWISGWLLAPLVRRGTGRTPMLAAAEIWGALHSPWAYWKTYGRVPCCPLLP